MRPRANVVHDVEMAALDKLMAERLRPYQPAALDRLEVIAARQKGFFQELDRRQDFRLRHVPARRPGTCTWRLSK
jgi:hypothetical protein